jgi:hypothetical protein
MFMRFRGGGVGHTYMRQVEPWLDAAGWGSTWPSLANRYPDPEPGAPLNSDGRTGGPATQTQSNRQDSGGDGASRGGGSGEDTDTDESDDEDGEDLEQPEDDDSDDSDEDTNGGGGKGRWLQPGEVEGDSRGGETGDEEEGHHL